MIQVIGYMDALQKMSDKLLIKNYSLSTKRTYLMMVKQYIDFFDGRIDTLSKADIVRFQRHLIEHRNVSLSYQNQSINAIKFYLEKVLGHDVTRYEIDRPRKTKRLPTVLSKDEIARVFINVSNMKHKAILYTIYSAGLRRSEAINLRISDIDSSNGRILVQQAKGRKDRITILSPVLLTLLRKYYRVYRPKLWLFEGPDHKKYSATSIQNILRRALKKSKIAKHATVHTLRHSFATHLLENGVNLRYIQTLLGHNSSRTTEIYTRVATSKLCEIQSPLDNLTCIN